MSAVLKPHASFHLESFSDEQGLRQMMLECLPVYAEMWDHGYSGERGVPFDPDMEKLTLLCATGARRFVTARIDGRIVAMQNWYRMQDVESRTRISAYMTGIYKRAPEVCDTVEFVKFGIAAMRASGCNQIILSAHAGRPGLKEKFEAAGARVAEYVMEV
jgi:hypothetical protein